MKDNFISIRKKRPFVVFPALRTGDCTLESNIVLLKSAAKKWGERQGSSGWARDAVFVDGC